MTENYNQNGDMSNDANGQDSQEDRKLFVGGLSWETEEKDLRNHFAGYGEIESINLKSDPTTGRSRGFAFIVFTNPGTIEKIMNAGEHVINDKKVDPKKAKARQGKIFVGGLPTELSDDEIKEFFGKFGTITQVEMPFDKVKNQRKGFCFITYELEQTVNELVKQSKQTLGGKQVDVKRATPKPDYSGGFGMRGGMMMRGARGGGMRGGRGRGFGAQGGWGGPGFGGYGQGGFGGGYEGYGQGGYGGGYDYNNGGGYGYGGEYNAGTGFGGKQRGGATRGTMRGTQRYQPY